MNVDISLVGMYACICLSTSVCLQSHTHIQNLGSLGFVCTKCVYGCIIKDFKHLVLIVCFAAAVLRKFLSYCVLMRVLASVSLLLSFREAPLFPLSLSPSPSPSLSPSLPACLCSSLPLSLSEIADKRETGAASPEKRACVCGLAGSREFLFHQCSVLGGKCNVGAGAELDQEGCWKLREAGILV